MLDAGYQQLLAWQGPAKEAWARKRASIVLYVWLDVVREHIDCDWQHLFYAHPGGLCPALKGVVHFGV